MKPLDDILMDELAGRLDDPPLIAAVEAVYAEAQAEADRRRAVCLRDGRCCRFGEFGHCLFITSPELVHFLSRWPGQSPPPGPVWDRLVADITPIEVGGRCPFHVGRRCVVHAIRPLGCRLFFCQPGNKQWGRAAYERLQVQLKAVCKTRRLPYAYVEWTNALCLLVRRGLLTPSASKT